MTISRPSLSHLISVTLLLLVEVIANVILDSVAVPREERGELLDLAVRGHKPVGHQRLGLSGHPGQGLTGAGLSYPSHRAHHLKTPETVRESIDSSDLTCSIFCNSSMG